MARNSAHYRPTTVQLEFVRGCNRQCTFCGTQGIDPHIEYMKVSTLERILNILDKESRNYRPRFSIALRGEPTLHPLFITLLKQLYNFAKPRKCSIQLITNGAKLADYFEDVLKYVDDLIVDDYDGKLKPQIKSLRDKYSNREVEPIFTMEKGVPFNNPDYPRHRIVIDPPFNATINTSTARVLWSHCGAGSKPPQFPPTSRCTLPFRWMAIRYNGDVDICCDDFRQQAFIKSFMDEDVSCLDDIWRCDRFESYRRILFHDGRVFLPCNKCNHKSMRPGLLPDPMGKERLEIPEKQDYEEINKKFDPRVALRLRQWENENGN